MADGAIVLLSVNHILEDSAWADLYNLSKSCGKPRNVSSAEPVLAIFSESLYPNRGQLSTEITLIYLAIFWLVLNVN